MWYRTAGCMIMLTLSLLAAPLVAEAQQRGKVPRIGFLGDGSAASRAANTLEPFRAGLRELGYVEGENVILEVRWTDGHSERLPELAGEFVRLPVDVIVTHGAPGARAATAATTTIPIVVAAVADMVRLGLVASLAHPGGNVTGLSDLLPELNGKLVELLTETLPGLTRVAVLWNRLNPGAALQAEAAQTAAREVGLQVSALAVRSPDEIAEVLATAAKGGVGAVIVVGDPLTNEHRIRIAQLALQERLPMSFISPAGRSAVEAGGLMSYGQELPSRFKRAAVFVDKILKGAKPADLPVEQPMKFELIINLKTAKALGITIPPSLLVLADEVIQ
jgi:putative tryptophan/tyrosine transport system substrate-binding protein